MKRILIKFDSSDRVKALIKDLEENYPEAIIIYRSNEVGRPPLKLEQAESFIQDLLQSKQMRSTIFNKLARKEGIRYTTLVKAKKSLGVKSKKIKNVWYVSL